MASSLARFPPLRWLGTGGQRRRTAPAADGQKATAPVAGVEFGRVKHMLFQRLHDRLGTRKDCLSLHYLVARLSV